jgi:hypothetical protein
MGASIVSSIAFNDRGLRSSTIEALPTLLT